MTAGPATLSISVEPGSAVRCAWVTHTERPSRRMLRRAGCPIQRSSLHYRRARRLRWLTSPPMTWALRRTPSGRPAHASQPTTLRKLGPGNGSGSACTFLPLSVNWFSTINNAGAPSAGTSSTTDLNSAKHFSRRRPPQPSRKQVKWKPEYSYCHRLDISFSVPPRWIRCPASSGAGRPDIPAGGTMAIFDIGADTLGNLNKQTTHHTKARAPWSGAGRTS